MAFSGFHAELDFKQQEWDSWQFWRYPLILGPNPPRIYRSILMRAAKLEGREQPFPKVQGQEDGRKVCAGRNQGGLGRAQGCLAAQTNVGGSCSSLLGMFCYFAGLVASHL